MESLHIKTKQLIHPLAPNPQFAFLISMNNTNYETGEQKILQTYVMTTFENKDNFQKTLYNNGRYPNKELILDTVFGCVTSPCRNESFDTILEKIIEDGPNGDIDDQYIDWNTIRASLIRCNILHE